MEGTVPVGTVDILVSACNISFVRSTAHSRSLAILAYFMDCQDGFFKGGIQSLAENRERSPAENPPLQNTIVRN
jgi:hypothetical protein